MALSKPEKLAKISWETKTPTTISHEKAMEVCRVQYSKVISIEIIEHLLGGINMDYVTMELENSFDCFSICKSDILDRVKEEKKRNPHV